MSARIFHENPVEHAVDEELRWENGFEMQKSKTSESSICSFSDRNSRPWIKKQDRVREKVFRLTDDFSVLVDFLNFDWDIQYFSNIHLRFSHTFSLSFKNRRQEVLNSTTNYKDFQQKVWISTCGGEKVLRLTDDINDWAMLGKTLTEINHKSANHWSVIHPWVGSPLPKAYGAHFLALKSNLQQIWSRQLRPVGAATVIALWSLEFERIQEWVVRDRENLRDSNCQ